MIQNKFFERAIANLKKQVSVPDAGRGNFNVFRGEMPTANFALRDQLAQQGQVQQQQDAEQQSQFSAIAQSLGGMVKGKENPREKYEMAIASKVNPALTTPSGGQPIDVAKVGRDVQGMPEDVPPIKTLGGLESVPIEPQIETLGGLESVPVETGDGQMVGNQPFNKQYSQEEVDAVINPPMSPAEKKLKEIREIEARDYKKGGKDYDKKHDWKDALRSAGLGALEALANADVRNGVGGMVGAAIGGAGGGAIGGTFDRHFDNKIQDQNKLKQLYPAYERLFETEKGINDEKRKKDSAESILRDRESDNKRLQEKSDRDYEMKTRTLDWKKEDRDRYYDLEDVKQKARERKDEATFKMAERKQAEIEKNNVANRESREKIAGLNQDGQDRRTQARIEAQKAITDLQEAQKNGRQAEIIAARERLVQLRKEAKANGWEDARATGEARPN